MFFVCLFVFLYYKEINVTTVTFLYISIHVVKYCIYLKYLKEFMEEISHFSSMFINYTSQQKK
jgi:hypothetical protein